MNYYVVRIFDFFKKKQKRDFFELVKGVNTSSESIIVEMCFLGGKSSCIGKINFDGITEEEGNSGEKINFISIYYEEFADVIARVSENAIREIKLLLKGEIINRFNPCEEGCTDLLMYAYEYRDLVSVLITAVVLNREEDKFLFKVFPKRVIDEQNKLGFEEILPSLPVCDFYTGEEFYIDINKIEKIEILKLV